MKNPRANDNRFYHLVIGVVELSHFDNTHKVSKRQLVKTLARSAKYDNTKN